jgi:hypothetical protein
LKPQDALALLRDLEELLGQLRSVGVASYRRQLEIESEISEIRCELEHLGFLPSK